MTQILYYLFIIPVSLLPYPVLYGLSNCLYYIFYYVVGYRKAVVVRNIENSFPGKTQAERVQIIKEFYRHFCDLMLESLKVFTISRKDVVVRMTFNLTMVFRDAI